MAHMKGETGVPVKTVTSALRDAAVLDWGCPSQPGAAVFSGPVPWSVNVHISVP